MYYAHQMHAIEYARGNVHTNGIENFWSLLKRTIGGTYVSVEPFHLFRHIDEQAFRFNTRKVTDASRFESAVASIVGKHLTYSNLTGKELLKRSMKKSRKSASRAEAPRGSPECEAFKEAVKKIVQTPKKVVDARHLEWKANQGKKS